eukprot:4658628-Prymnesium_polylepis.1
MCIRDSPCLARRPPLAEAATSPASLAIALPRRLRPDPVSAPLTTHITAIPPAHPLSPGSVRPRRPVIRVPSR